MVDIRGDGQRARLGDEGGVGGGGEGERGCSLCALDIQLQEHCDRVTKQSVEDASRE